MELWAQSIIDRLRDSEYRYTEFNNILATVKSTPLTTKATLELIEQLNLKMKVEQLESAVKEMIFTIIDVLDANK
jgi:hypothetical protein